MTAENVLAVFVYGTLKRGQCRSTLWPAEPVAVQSAVVAGRLFHRSDYPAMRPAETVDPLGTIKLSSSLDHSWVQGERWSFQPDQIGRVLHRLDQIEVTNQPGVPDLYYRAIVDSFDDAGRPLGRAYTYFYASDPIDDGFAPGDSKWPMDSG